MKRTISIKLIAAKEQALQLEQLRDSFLAACNAIVPFAILNALVETNSTAT